MFFLYQIIVTIILLFSPIILIFRLIKKKEDKFRFREKLSVVNKNITSKTKMVYCESISNPLLDVSDLPELSKITKKHAC